MSNGGDNGRRGPGIAGVFKVGKGLSSARISLDGSGNICREKKFVIFRGDRVVSVRSRRLVPTSSASISYRICLRGIYVKGIIDRTEDAMERM